MSSKDIIKKISNVILILTIAFLVIWTQRSNSTSNSPNINESTRYIIAMDTVIKLTAYGDGADQAISEAANKLAYIDDLMNANLEGSDVFNISNSNATATQVSFETYQVISSALKYSEITSGKFDISVRPLVELWGFGKEGVCVPSHYDIEACMQSVGYRGIELLSNNCVRLADNMKIDLGAIAKGYAADEVGALFKEDGLSGIIDLGGNILTIGENPKSADGKWRIGVADPFDPEDVVLYVDTPGTSLVTSGDYQRYFEEDGVFYHHILDPFTGYPADTDLKSATVISASSIDADALSTCAFILGSDAGMELIESFPDVTAIFITSDKRVIASAELEGKIQLIDSSYLLIFK